MKSSAYAMSELMAGSMTTTGRTMDVTARLTYVPRDPHVITVTITDRAGAVPIWTIGRDLLLGSLIARASWAEPNRPSGSMGIRTRRSQAMKASSSSTPAITEVSGDGRAQPPTGPPISP